jgi:hypothetical protein
MGEDAFARFWSVYPRRVNQDDARTAFARAIADGADAEEVIAGAQVYAAVRQAQVSGGDHPKFTVYPASWLKKRKWTDPPPDGLVIDEQGNVVEIEQPRAASNSGRGFFSIAQDMIDALEAQGKGEGWEW